MSEIQLFEYISNYKHESLKVDDSIRYKYMLFFFFHKIKKNLVYIYSLLSAVATNFINALLDPNCETRLGFGGVKKGVEGLILSHPSIFIVIMFPNYHYFYPDAYSYQSAYIFP